VALDNVYDYVYVGTGGYFNASTQGHIARFAKQAVDGKAQLLAWNPQVNYSTSNYVNFISVYQDLVSFTGVFTSVNAAWAPRDNMAVVSRTTAVANNNLNTLTADAPTTARTFPMVLDSEGAWLALHGYQEHGNLAGISKTSTLTDRDVAAGVTTAFPKFTTRLNTFDLNAPAITDGWIWVSVSDGAGGAFVGGAFRNIDGYDIANLAWIDANGRAKSDWTPEPNAAVRSLRVVGNFLYVGGEFSTIGGWGGSRRLARINISAGGWTPDTTWAPNIDGAVAAGQPIVSALEHDDDYIYFGIGRTDGSTDVTVTTASFDVVGLGGVSRTNHLVFAPWLPA
jgi:hypothetical protein